MTLRVEAALVTALAAVITLAIAAPVLRAPSERIFGMPIVGDHHDPFTFMRQIDQPIRTGVYLQPATDIPGALVALASGPVAAYNWLVLATFPLAALTAYLLARHLMIAPVWAVLAALAFAFSPFHLSHAAYHPHIAQIQWVPLYLLALWRCLDRPTRGAIALLWLAVGGITLSNFYGGLIAALITPAAIGAYWFFVSRRGAAPGRRLALTAASLAGATGAGLVYVWQSAPEVLADPAAYAAAPEDLVRYGARWWSYAVPPVEHPMLGALSRRIWHGAGVDVGVLEQQVALGWGVMALAAVALAAWVVRDRRGAPGSIVPALAVVAAVAMVCSLTAGVSTLLHDIVPMFRAYARFGVVVHLMVVLLAAIGAERIWRSSMRHARAICLALIAVAAAEYAVWPPWMSRSALPTRAHQWVARQPEPVRALDCAPSTEASISALWLVRYRISNSPQLFGDCMQSNLSEKLSAAGYTHLIVRRESAHGRWFASRRRPDGLQGAAHFDDSDVYLVDVLPSGVQTVSR